MSDPQYTERTHHGDFIQYRISEPGETFAEFMKRSPYYANDTKAQEDILRTIRMPFNGCKASHGWSDFTMTAYQARKIVSVGWVERLRNDRDGNPRYRLHTDAGYFDTEKGASINYGINNMMNPRIRETYILDTRPVTLVLTKRGYVTHIERDGRSLDK